MPHYSYKISISITCCYCTHLFLLILVESLSRFNAELALSDEFVQQWDGLEELLVGELLVPAIEDELIGVEPDVIRQLERTHGVARAQLHRDVDVTSGRVSW